MNAPITNILNTPDVLILEAAQPQCIGLFAVGRGGNPDRYLAFMQNIAEQGCTIIAPRFEMLASSFPTKDEVDNRIQRLEACADTYARRDLPIVGLGHSIGAVMMLALAGAEAETIQDDKVTSRSKWAFARLALFAPPTDFFRRFGALKAISVPIQVWTGEKDMITPPSQSFFLQEALASQVPIKIFLDEKAGHFTFMDVLPPQVSDPHPNRRMFLTSLAHDVAQFFIN